MSRGASILGDRSLSDGRRARPGPRIPIYVLVSLLLVGLALPAVGFLAHIIAQQNDQRELEVSRRGQEVASEIADALEQELRTMKTMLGVFVSSGWLQEDRLEELHRRAETALAGSERHLAVVDPELNEVFNTRVPFSSRIGRTADAETAAMVLESGSEVVSNVVPGRVVHGLVFNVMRPVVFPDGREVILMLGREAAGLNRLLNSTPQDSGWSYAVLDGADQVVTSSTAPSEASDAIPDACLEPTRGFRRWESAESSQYIFDHGVTGAPWRVCAWGAAERLREEAEASWTTLLTASVAWFGIALIAAGGLSASISRAISTTAKVGEALEAGRAVTVSGSYIREVDEVRSTLSRAAADRLRKEEELQLLLGETAHRAKNQIALAVSLVGLSARGATTVEELRNDVTGRLSALARSVDALAGRKGDAAELGELIAAQLKPFVDIEGRLRAEGPDVFVSQAAAQSLSLVLHELATNASKHGAWSRPDGVVTIDWRIDGDAFLLDWTERGVPASPPERTGFGTKLAHVLVERKLRGTVDRQFGEAGFRCRIAVPLQAIQAPAAP